MFTILAKPENNLLCCKPSDHAVCSWSLSARRSPQGGRTQGRPCAQQARHGTTCTDQKGLALGLESLPGAYDHVWPQSTVTASRHHLRITVTFLGAPSRSNMGFKSNHWASVTIVKSYWGTFHLHGDVSGTFTDLHGCEKWASVKLPPRLPPWDPHGCVTFENTTVTLG
jgi:hypothetical protein